jgi:hypothetical protein
MKKLAVAALLIAIIGGTVPQTSRADVDAGMVGRVAGGVIGGIAHLVYCDQHRYKRKDVGYVRSVAECAAAITAGAVIGNVIVTPVHAATAAKNAVSAVASGVLKGAEVVLEIRGGIIKHFESLPEKNRFALIFGLKTLCVGAYWGVVAGVIGANIVNSGHRY